MSVWTEELLVDDGAYWQGTSGAWVSSASCLDSSGLPHFALYSWLLPNGANQLRHVYWDGNAWQTELIKQFPSYSYLMDASIYLRDGKAHTVVANRIGAGGGPYTWYLHYFTNAGGAWAEEVLYSGATSVSRAVIGVSSTQKAHILYLGISGGDNKILYLTNATGSWVPEVTAIRTNYTPNIMVTMADVIKVVAKLGSSDDLYLLIRQGASWIDYAISTLWAQDYSPYLAADGVIHLSYDANDETMRYVYGDENGWSAPEVILNTEDAQGKLSLFVDGANCYFMVNDYGNLATGLYEQYLRYAIRTPGGWQPCELISLYTMFGFDFAASNSIQSFTSNDAPPGLYIFYRSTRGKVYAYMVVEV